MDQPTPPPLPKLPPPLPEAAKSITMEQIQKTLGHVATCIQGVSQLAGMVEKHVFGGSGTAKPATAFPINMPALPGMPALTPMADITPMATSGLASWFPSMPVNQDPNSWMGMLGFDPTAMMTMGFDPNMMNGMSFDPNAMMAMGFDPNMMNGMGFGQM